MPVTFDIELKGPVFTNPSAKVQDAMGDILQAAVEEGEKHLDEMLRPRPAGVYLNVSTAEGGSVGNYRKNVQGKVEGNLHALITDGGCVYGPWLEGVGSRNATTRFKGYSSFRRTAQYLVEHIGVIAEGVIKKLIGKLD